MTPRRNAKGSHKADAITGQTRHLFVTTTGCSRIPPGKKEEVPGEKHSTKVKVCGKKDMGEKNVLFMPTTGWAVSTGAMKLKKRMTA